jgi:hypothetical protein
MRKSSQPLGDRLIARAKQRIADDLIKEPPPQVHPQRQQAGFSPQGRFPTGTTEDLKRLGISTNDELMISPLPRKQ